MEDSSTEDTKQLEGWKLDPREVRQIAVRMGFSSATPLPDVIAVDKDADEYYSRRPQINQDLEGDYFITLPEKFMERVGKDDYVLGSRAREDIRHELAHYEDYLKGGRAGQEKEPYEQALKEVRVELRTKPKTLSLVLTKVAGGLAEDFDLSDEDALKTTAEAARELGVSSRVISRMYRLCEEVE